MPEPYRLWQPEKAPNTSQTVSFLIDDYLLFLYAAGRQESTVQDKRHRLRLYHQWLCDTIDPDPTVDHLTAHNYRAFLAHLQSPEYGKALSPYTIRGYGRVIKAFSRWLTREGHFEQDPLRFDKVPPAPKSRIHPFTDAETDALLDAIDWRFPECAWRQMALLVFLLDTGVRVSELVTLTDDNLHLEEQRAFVLGKGQKARFVYVGNQCKRVLHRYIEGYRPEGLGVPTYVFRAPDGGGMSRDRIEQICRGLGKRAGVNKCHPHRFRHTFGYRFIRAGGNVFSLQRLLGHAQISTVMIYVELQEEDIASAHAQFSPGDRLRLPRR